MTIREAAERLRIYKSQPNHAADAKWWQGDYQFGRAKVMEDIMELADAWIAENPADSEMAVDEVWLRSVGFVQDYRTLTFEHRHSNERTTTIELSTKYGEWSIGSGNGRHNSLIRINTVPATRGDVRRLAKCLGVTLEEAK